MQTLNNNDLAFLAMLGHPELTVKVLKLYAQKTYLFTEMFCPHLNAMWNAYVELLKEHKKEYGLNLSRDIIAAGLVEAVEADRSMPDELKEKCDTLLHKLTTNDVPDLETGNRLVGHLVQMEGNRRLMAKANANADILTLQQSLDASKRAMEPFSAQKDEASPEDEIKDALYHPFKDIRKLAKKVVLVPTGINWMDEVSSGGGRAGELWLILGPSGGGKSMLTVQYACAQAMLGNNTMWVTYEQSLEGDLAERMIANITDESLDHIRDVGFDNLPENIQQRFIDSVAGVDDRLSAVDMTKVELDPSDPDDYGGIRSIWKQFNREKEAGRKPKTVIIDWFGSMLIKIAGKLGVDLEKRYRFLAQAEIDIALEFAKKEQVLVIFLHQLDVKGTSARPTYMATAAQAQNMHNMQDFFTLVFVMGVRDSHDVCWFHSGKARKSKKVVRTLRLIGDKAKFVMENCWLPDTRKGEFYKPGSETDGLSGDFSGIAEDYTREIQ